MQHLGKKDPLLNGVYWVPDAGACSGVYILENGRTLIDTGNMYGLIDEFKEIGNIDKLERIFLTHTHFDHIGGMAEIFQYVSPDVYLHKIARGYLNLHRDPFPAFFDALEKEGKLKLLNDGDTLEGSPTLLVIHAPGHTAGDVVYYDPNSRSIFAGDVVLPYSLRYGPILSKPDEICGGRLKDKIASLKKLLKLKVRHLFPGHGNPVFDRGHDQIKIALATLLQAVYDNEPEKAWIEMGFALLNAGFKEEARQCAEKARSVNPTSSELTTLDEQLIN